MGDNGSGRSIGLLVPKRAKGGQRKGQRERTAERGYWEKLIRERSDAQPSVLIFGEGGGILWEARGISKDPSMTGEQEWIFHRRP